MQKYLLCLLISLLTIQYGKADVSPTDFIVKLPELTGATIYPGPGDHKVKKNESFKFHITLDEKNSNSQLLVTINGEPVEEYLPDDTLLPGDPIARDLIPFTSYYKIDSVINDIQVKVEGIVENVYMIEDEATVRVLKDKSILIQFEYYTALGSSGVEDFLLEISEKTDSMMRYVGTDTLHIEYIIYDNPLRYSEPLNELYVQTQLEEGKEYVITVKPFKYGLLGKPVLYGWFTTPVFTYEYTSSSVSNVGLSEKSLNLSVSEGTLFVTSEYPETIQVISLTGAVIASRKVNGTETISLKRGIYLVKTETAGVHKIVIR